MDVFGPLGFGSRVDPDPVVLPAIFRGVPLRIPPLHTGGTLVIDHGLITIQTTGFTRAMSGNHRIAHTEPTVMIVTARLWVPWANTSMVLFDDEGVGCAITYLGGAGRWRSALAAAGFEVNEITTWSPPFAGAG